MLVDYSDLQTEQMSNIGFAITYTAGKSYVLFSLCSHAM